MPSGLSEKAMVMWLLSLRGGLITYPRDFAFDQFSTNDIAYITLASSLLKLKVSTRVVTKLTGGSGVPGSLSATRPLRLRGVTFVTDSVLLIADASKSQLMVADLARNKVTYICDGRSKMRNGNICTCSLNAPYSVLAMSWSVYIGEFVNIRRVSLKAINDLIWPADVKGRDFYFNQIIFKE